MDILNTKRNNIDVNVNVIDKHIQEINNLHHNVDNNLGPENKAISINKYDKRPENSSYN